MFARGETMASISDKWIDKLDILPAKDYITLTKAILKNEPEPKISSKFQPIATEIYGNLKERNRAKEGMRISRSNRNSYSNVTVTLQQSYSNVTQEEKKDTPPSSSPSSSPLLLPPTPPIINPPIIPPSSPPSSPPTEKREEACVTGARACVETPAETKTPKQTYSQRFEKLWEAYPRKEGKKNAFAAYQRAVRDGAKDEDILSGIEQYKDKLRRDGTEERFIAQGATFFNQRRWEDSYASAKESLMSAEDLEDMYAVFG